ncbi:hypothetical protein VTN77DRAFT_7786 [Rasamsonia byssochlamydoides]|uniref:uncharacterized protein n=1 Tax=Rasamsonia byssochlamydoides TaxID=89139 RepID=UPI0037424E18
MQWHTADNLVSWYTYHEARSVERLHNLRGGGGWNRVTSIIPLPHLWDALRAAISFPLLPRSSAEFKPHHRKHGFRYLLCLEGIEDPGEGVRLCLFPRFLKAEFHAVRATIEAYSARGRMERPERLAVEGYVGDICIEQSEAMMYRKRVFRVTDAKEDRRVYETVLFE